MLNNQILSPPEKKTRFDHTFHGYNPIRSCFNFYPIFVLHGHMTSLPDAYCVLNMLSKYNGEKEAPCSWFMVGLAVFSVGFPNESKLILTPLMSDHMLALFAVVLTEEVDDGIIGFAVMS